MEEKSRPSWTQGRRIPQAVSSGPAPAVTVQDRAGTNGVDYPADLVFIVKEDGTILYLNRHRSGADEVDVSGTSILSYTAAEHQMTLRESIARVFATGEAHGFECCGSGPFSEEALYQCRVAPNKRDGRVVSATIIARDITRLRHAEVGVRTERDELEQQVAQITAQLRELKGTLVERDGRESELRRFRSMIDQAGEAIFITDTKTGRFLDVNETACSWLGRSRDKLLTLKIDDIDLEFPLGGANGISDHVTDTRDNDRPRVYTSGRHRRRNGTSFPVEVAIARGRCGDQEFMLAVARDIKERQKAEESLRESESKFRSLFELSRDAVYLSSRDGTVAEGNEAAVDLFGYTRSEFIGLEATRLYSRAEDIRSFQQGVTDSGVVRDVEVEFRAKDGASIPGLLSATLRYSGDGSILGYLCIIRPRTVTEVLGPISEPEEVASEPAKTLSVLVVDEQKQVLSEIKTLLERAAIPVLTARTGAAGVEVLKSQAGGIGVVLIGLRPDETGSSGLVQDFRQTDPELHIVLMREESGSGVPGTFDNAGLEVVPKPIHPIALIQHVRDALGIS